MVVNKRLVYCKKWKWDCCDLVMGEFKMLDYDIFKSVLESSEEEEMKVSDCEWFLIVVRNGEFDVIRDFIILFKWGEINLDVNCKGLWIGWV